MSAGSAAEHGRREVEVDARGLRCPLPVVRLAAAARDLPPGSVVTVLATDLAADIDVPAWAQMRGHRVVGSERVLVDTPEGPRQPEQASIDPPPDESNADDESYTDDLPAGYTRITVVLGGTA